MEATATLGTESSQMPTTPLAPDLPGTSSQNSSSSSSNSNTNNTLASCMDTDNIGWSKDTMGHSQLRHRGAAAAATASSPSTSSGPASSSTAYSFTGSALSSANVSEQAEADAAASPSSSTTTGGGSSSNEKEKETGEDSLYECNICLDTAKDAVVSMCGHLFCWPCLHQWLQTRPNRKLCPVCKAAVDKDKVIPLYGRNSTRQEDPRNKVPPRPAGQRTEPEPAPGFPGFGFGDGFHMSFGIGAFPFGFFTSSLNFGEPRPAAANRGTTQYEDEQTLSKLFLYLAFLCFAWLLFA